MIITPQVIAGLFRQYRQEFEQALNAAEPDWNKVAMRVPSSTVSNTYGWLGQFPGMREWVGERVIQDMATHGYTIVNRPFESTVGIRRTDIADDNLGIYSPMVAEMGRMAKVFPDEKLIFPLFSQGFTTACYDGQNFFDTEHPVYPSVDGTGVATSVANYDPGVDGTGEPWFLIDTSRAIKPFIYQDRESPSFQQMTRTDDEQVFMSDVYRFGAQARGNGGFGLWQLAYASRQPLTAENFRKAYDAMRAYKADGLRPLGIKPTTLVCNTSQELAADNVINVAKLPNGADNPNYKKVGVLATPWLN